MATFEYVDIPVDAIRLKSFSLEPATKLCTALPQDATFSSSPPSDSALPAKSALGLVPQMLLSSSSPASSIIASAITSPNPHTQPYTLLSTRDPLSVPIMTANFRRFVSKIGPVFWLQDRIEETILWKRGWKRTTAWLAAYAFFCYYPRMILLIPHILLLGVMLYCYPDPGVPQTQINVEGTADWQANIQGIQNLMGAVSDAHDAVVPLLPLLIAPRAASHPSKSKSPSHESASHPAPKPSRCVPDSAIPYTTPAATQPHHPLLIATLLSFLLFLPLLTFDILPLRLIFFVCGTGTVVALHPRIKDPLSNVASTALYGSGPGLSFQLSVYIPCLPNPLVLVPFVFHRVRCSPRPPCMRTFTFTLTPRDVYLFFRRLIDDDTLDDAVWHAPLAQVELWENERWVQAAPENKRRKSFVMLVREGREVEEISGDEDAASTTSTATSATLTGLGEAEKGPKPAGAWSKANLRPSERVGWTRGRDGWCGVGGEVSSNLTFSLSSGWAFVESESWRPDLKASWAVEKDANCSASVCVGADEDGWTYTTDTWTHPRPDGRPSDGWVTRRRRWVRRVYFQGER